MDANPQHALITPGDAVTNFDTDYLVIGAGASGLAFADTLLQQSDAHITLVDKHAQPGGHWTTPTPSWHCTSLRPSTA